MRKYLLPVLIIAGLFTITGGEAASAHHGKAKGKPSGCRHPERTKADCARKHRRLDRLGYPRCNRWSCVHKTRREQFREWKVVYIPDCTWYGESGPGPEFAEWRYTVPNSSGSDAFGKYQMMPGTYHAYAQHHDWSKGDQEEAAHRLYAAQGTSPWEAC